MIIKKSTLISEFRECRGQNLETSKPTPPTRERKTASTPYEHFLRKYNSLEEEIDNFGTRDLVYYFREIAQENGYKYVISNIKKDMYIMKRLLSDYSTREICGMIEFLYESDQDYLEKDRLSINLLASQWINTIYADMRLWVKDSYSPKSKTKKELKGEWKDSTNETKIGGKI